MEYIYNLHFSVRHLEGMFFIVVMHSGITQTVNDPPLKCVQNYV